MGIYEKLSKLVEEALQADLFTVIAGEGGAEAGSKLLFGKGRVLHSDLTGPTGEKVAAALMEDNGFEAAGQSTARLTEVRGEDIPALQVFAQRFTLSPRLIILGGGHVGAALCRLASLFDYEIIVADDRPAYASASAHPAANRVICDDFEKVFHYLEPSASDYIVIVTRGHRHDRDCLEMALLRDAAYVGMIGSRSRVAAQLKELADSGYTEQQLRRIHSPIGLSIRAVTESEIALSILAEITLVRRGAGEGESGGWTVLRQLVELEKSQQTAALVTIVNSAGSVPRKTGSQLLVYPDGRFFGTIGGGCAEAEARREALNALDRRRPLKTRIRMSADAAADEGMACGGIIDIFIEPINT